MRIKHPIFNTPHAVKLTIEDRPPSESYPTRASGKELGDTMPMWRVQTEGYLDDKGMLVGVVSPTGLEDSPDGEFISGGMNTKGQDAVAIGRQGNFLHWGFAASPTYMTDEAKRVFVNAIHYIHRFAGHRAFVENRSHVTRASLDDTLYGISDQGHQAWCAMIETMNAKLAADAVKLKERKKNGETLTDWEESMLKMPSSPPWSRDRVIGWSAPPELRERLGTDWAAYTAYYTENRPYLHPVAAGEHRTGLDVDPDAKALGIANNTLAFLDRCVADLEAGKESERAQRVLLRYTNEAFTSPAEWRSWLGTNRDKLFFTEVGGFKFMVDINPAPIATAPNKPHAEIKVPKPTAGKPVQLNAGLQHNPDGTVTVVVKARILGGWHIYSQVPANQPYVVTTLELEPTGLTAVGQWAMPNGRPYPELPGVTVYEGNVTFERTLEVDSSASGPRTVKVVVGYQTCDHTMCFPPTTKEFTLALD